MLTATDVARLLRMKTGTIYDWVQMGKLPFHRIGRSIRFEDQEIQDWIASKKFNRRNHEKGV